MSTFKRLFISMFAKVDEVVGEIENHEALIKAAMQEHRKKLSAAKVELARIKRHEQDIQEKLKTLEYKRDVWAKRAVNEAALSEEKALACMQQRELILGQINKLTTILNKYAETSRKMQSDITRGEAELSELTQKHQILRARQSTAEALNMAGGIAGTNWDDLEASFDRWEVKISQSEYGVDTEIFNTEMENLDQLYVKSENEQHLKEQLEALLNGDKNHG